MSKTNVYGDFRDELVDGLLKHEFRRGVRVGVDKACQMLRLLPKEKWEQAVSFLEKEEFDESTWARVEEIKESEKVIDAEIIE